MIRTITLLDLFHASQVRHGLTIGPSRQIAEHEGVIRNRLFLFELCKQHLVQAADSCLMHRAGVMCNKPGKSFARLYPAQEATAVKRMKPNYG